MNTKNIIKHAVLLVITIGFMSCRGFIWNCIDGNGTIEGEYRNLSGFNGIKVTGNFDVHVTQGDDYEVFIETDENLFSFIETDIKSNKLRLKTMDNRCLDPSRNIDVYVTLPEIRELKLTGSGYIDCDSINTLDLDVILTGSGDISLGQGAGFIIADDLKINNTGSGEIYIDVDADYIDADIAGSGEIELEGSAYETNFVINGSGDIDAYELFVNLCEVKISGSGSAKVNVRDRLDIKITGSGDVYYIGDVDVDDVSINITGSGSVKDKN